MTKIYMIIYENNDGELFKTVKDRFTSKKEALNYFKENNTKYGYKVIAIRKITTNNIYL